MRGWIPNLEACVGPYYLAIADALEAAIHAGVIRAGDRLPSQRMLADLLGLHVNTVNRAMRESARRGLTRGQSRRGTVIDRDIGHVTVLRPVMDSLIRDGR